MTYSTLTILSQVQPALHPGKHRIDLSHAVHADEARTFGKSYEFQVQGERFSFNPQLIKRVFPPRSTLGVYDAVLPHVVLGRSTLPWERRPRPSDAASDDDAQESWLALLVFGAGSAPKTIVGTLADLLPQGVTGGSLPSGFHSYGSPYTDAGSFLETGEALTDACTFIDIPALRFAASAPSVTDIAWNAHVRSRRADGGTTSDAVVVANSLPPPGQAVVVHLVSLEGLADQLPRDDGTFAAAPSWQTIRVVSLSSWQFRVAPLEASFAHMLLGLNGGVAATASPTDGRGDSQLRLAAGLLPAAAPPGAPALAFASGYTVLAGDGPAPPPSAWYRGPLLPSTVTPASADAAWADTLLPSTSAAALAVAVAGAPAQDLSYAAAWQLGRLLALADADFASGQVCFKRDARQQLNTALGQAGRLAAGSRAAFAKLLRAALADPDQIKAQLGSRLSADGAEGTLAIPQSLVDWLGRLALLQLVPFNYLVPDPRMFPPESLRFFSVDPRWLACLLDGAWSLDRQPRLNWGLDVAYQPWRQLLDGSLKPSPSGWAWPAGGLLLGSQVVPGYWPGVTFTPTPAATMAREAVLGSDVVLALFEAPLSAIELAQPPEGIHFGFDYEADSGFTKCLRYIDVGGLFYPTPPEGVAVTAGQEAPLSVSLDGALMRNATVIRFGPLARAIADASGAPPLRAVDFAVELVESVSSVTFALPSGATA